MALSSVCIGFKGINNSSAMIVDAISQQHYLLTNSFSGLKNDIDKLPEKFDAVFLFGANKDLTNLFCIEQCAERNRKRLFTELDVDHISICLSAVGIESTISYVPTHYLCNEAYWYLLEKYHGRAVLIHIPTIRNIHCMLESAEHLNDFFKFC